MDCACHVIQRNFNPRFLNQMTSYDEANAIHHHFGLSFHELNDIL